MTGFEPFGEDRANPSSDAVRNLASKWQGTDTLVTEILPVAFDHGARRMRDLIAKHRPDLVLAVGLAGGRNAISIERVAVNLVDARIPDNAGAQPIDVPSVDGAPPAYFTTLPVKAITAAINDAGISTEISYTAGTFVCNHVFFTALDAVEARARVGFIHVPWADGQAPADQATMPIDDIVEALDIAISTALRRTDDLAEAGGTLY
ncbi:pyroglutamyl-peptidase I [Epidermidibacterium keratini]|uniref:pyroglutamyl-peptidase I n=1 Tax=Epidermidibacterium keratini TaxID=1891644 RepID=UPI001CEF973B|nr:pyroglutamyl-peptidase I [Epidermidibacterium keratini]